MYVYVHMCVYTVYICIDVLQKVVIVTFLGYTLIPILYLNSVTVVIFLI